ncbi:hypothetical protein [Amycolatopsis sp. NPDC098790]|uniref:hypothetical protein n=1 Tax=Amycolatopsis sp. NPDC098790 TaxID=3363939 RepID=UPI00380E0A5E
MYDHFSTNLLSYRRHPYGEPNGYFDPKSNIRLQPLGAAGQALTGFDQLSDPRAKWVNPLKPANLLEVVLAPLTGLEISTRMHHVQTAAAKPMLIDVRDSHPRPRPLSATRTHTAPRLGLPRPATVVMSLEYRQQLPADQPVTQPHDFVVGLV